MAPRKKTSNLATSKGTKRSASVKKANGMPSMSEMNTLAKSNTTKRDRALIALATASALGAAAAACGSRDGCKKAVMGTAEAVSSQMRDAAERAKKASVSVRQTLMGMGLIEKPWISRT